MYWVRASRILRGLRRTLPKSLSPGGSVPGSERIARPSALRSQYGHLAVQPVSKSRVWGVNSFAQLPAFGGKVRKEIAQQCGRRAPEASRFEKGTNAGLCLVAPDPDPALTGASAGVVRQPVAAGVLKALVRNTAELLVELFVAGVGEHPRGPGAAAVVAKYTRGFAGKYAQGSGF